jgi:hypothetical protein
LEDDILRYLIFAFPIYMPAGGIADLIGAGNDREKMMDAIRAKLDSERRFQLVDLKTGQVETFFETFINSDILVTESNCYDGFGAYAGIQENP